MATFILLADYTDSGFRHVKDSPKRLDAAREAAAKLGVQIRDFYLCMGGHDIVAVIEAANDEAMAGFVLSLAGVGAVRTTTLKAFDERQYREIIGAL
jgi:uncharacterized protein with GYD domain